MERAIASARRRDDCRSVYHTPPRGWIPVCSTVALGPSAYLRVRRVDDHPPGACRLVLAFLNQPRQAWDLRLSTLLFGACHWRRIPIVERSPPRALHGG